MSESADPTKLGRSFGLHKALDMMGSAAGILAAFAFGAALSFAAALVLAFGLHEKAQA